MTPDDLLKELTDFLHGRQASNLCRPYHTEPIAALGDLFLRLVRRIKKPIRQPKIWVAVNGGWYLRNYLRRECRALCQTREGLQ